MGREFSGEPMDSFGDILRAMLEGNRSMKQDCGWFLPDHEEHLQGWMKRMKQQAPGGRLGYQLHKYQAALPYVKDRRVAVDVGAHVGLWTWPMAHDFSRVVAFEPMPLHRECWEANIAQYFGPGEAALFPVALGEAEGTAHILTRTENSSGDTGVDLNGDGIEVEMKRLDDFDLDNVDFLKIDCEGYELFVLRGAIETLKRCHPCIVVEQKPETGGADRYGIGYTDAVDFLVGLGAKQRTAIQGDYILSWD